MQISADRYTPILMPVETNTQRSAWPSIVRGFLGRCPNCGHGNMFERYLKVSDTCGQCGEELHHHRADDAPPYFTIFLIGHLILPAALLVEKFWHPSLTAHFSIWLPAIVASTLLLLPRVKGAIVGLQWALYLHGFETAARTGQKSSASSTFQP